MLLSVGQAVFEFEDVAKTSRSDVLEIVIAPALLSPTKANKLSKVLEQLIEFVLMQSVAVSFKEQRDPFQLDAIEASVTTDAVALFSGGVDSLSGAMLAPKYLSRVDAAFCAHLHQGRRTG